MTGTFSSDILAQISGQSTAPLPGGTKTTDTTGTSATTTPKTTQTPPVTTKSADDTKKDVSAAFMVNAGWASALLSAIVGLTML